MSDPIERPPTLLAMPTYLASWVSKRARADVQLALAEHGLATSDHGVLVALGDFGALSQQQLADRLGADKSHVVRLIDQLEQRGLITRAADPTDRRRHRIELTPAGRALLQAVTPIAEEVEAAHLKALSAAERRTLASLLQRVLESQDHTRTGQRA
jgi:MarR family transcriptional regulator, lower aerobic nicotinate degradation pathway regulator